MDKFGIFKLLNSFYDFYSKNKGGNSQPSPFENVEKVENQNEFSPNENKTNAPQKKNVPLQNSMLSTMRNHDEILRRVKSTQNKST